MSLDLAFMNRDTARNPIRVYTLKEIERECRWGFLKRLALPVTVSLGLWAVIMWALVGFFS